MKPKFFAAIITLLNNEKRPDLDAMEMYIDFLIQKKTSGFFPRGTTGEYAAFSDEDNLEVLQLVKKKADAANIPLIPCASTGSLWGTVEIISRMKELGIPLVSLSPPYYLPLEQHDVLAYYDVVLKETDVDLYLYNIPAFTTGIAFDTFRKLLQNPRILGIKDSSGSMKHISRYIAVIEEERPDFQIMTGSDELLLSALTAGANGCVSALSGIVPEAHRRINALRTSDPAAAKRIQNAMTRLTIECESLSMPLGYRLALKARGFASADISRGIPGIPEHINAAIINRLLDLLNLTEML